MCESCCLADRQNLVHNILSLLAASAILSVHLLLLVWDRLAAKSSSQSMLTLGVYGRSEGVELVALNTTNIPAPERLVPRRLLAKENHAEIL